MSTKYSPKSISLGWYSSEEIAKISCVEVTLPTSFDIFGHQVPDGLYDLRMGPLKLDQNCQTCNLGYLACPGHFGHYKLSKPVVNPLCFDTAYALLKSCCLGCFHFKITTNERLALYTKLKSIKKGIHIANIDSFINGKVPEDIEKELNNIKQELTGYENSLHYEHVSQFLRKTSGKLTCPRCHIKSPKFTKEKGLRVLKSNVTGLIDYVSPFAIKETLTKLAINETALLTEFFNSDSIDHLFLNVIPIMPNKFRPANFLGEKVSESPLNCHLSRIINFSVMAENDDRYLPDLQALVLYYFDSSKSPTSTFVGHKQILEKKEGLFRQNIMGKRVNYAARSVISPDPNLETREVGVPLVFASALTFPEKVTTFNFDKLRQMVINGSKYPGANFVESNGGLINLKFISQEHRLSIANQLMDGEKIVWRHLEDRDPVLFNRQPTLHSSSLMGHYAKVLKNEKTIRMHYVNCKSYNADFDGDEMNMHFPQSYNALSEIHNLALNDNIYFVPSSGEPIRGLTQDHIIAAAMLSMKDSFFTKEEYFSIVEFALVNLNYKDKLLKSQCLSFVQPCILSPVPLFSGKQIVTTLLNNLNIYINFSIKSKLKFPGEETTFKVFKGEVISGVLDKASIGASPFSLIHACGEIYGYKICNDLLTIISRMVNKYMSIKGFTVRFDDFLLDEEADKKRQELFLNGNKLALLFQELGCPDNFDQIKDKCQVNENFDNKGIHPAFNDPKFYFDDAKIAILDAKMKTFMNSFASAADKIFQPGMFKKYPTNNMVNIVQSGSKGSLVNLSQISSQLGQQELEGKRVPFMISGKTLPCFKRMEMAPAAGGFIFERFLTGLNPATFYFHCMAGREGLIDTAVKTANSGYLQRCMAKHLEGVSIKYDGKVMIDDRILQFKYGDDGLNVNKASYLNNFDFYKTNIDLFSHKSTVPLSECQMSKITPTFIESVSSMPDLLKNFLLNRFLNSLASPGHPAGMLAAQSVGEPSTQMTLNTFHLAGVGGKNVTLGIPRLREIIMVASKAIKTPIISLPLLKPEEANSVVNIFRKVTLQECIEKITVEEKIVNKDMEYKKQIKIIFSLGSHVELAAKCIDVGFLKLLGKELKKRSSATGITEYSDKKISTSPSNDEVENNEPVDEDESSESSSKTEIETAADIEFESKASEELDDENQTEIGFLEDLEETTAKEESEEIEADFVNLKKLSNNRYSFEIYYPTDFNILLLPIIESLAEKLIVKQIKGFNKATFSSGEVHLEGSNFLGLLSIYEGKDLLEILDFYNSHTNDIYAIYKTFGVEAARAVIVKEIVNVFDVYGIKIDFRHLHLVADYMTKDGLYKSFSRHSFTMDDCFIEKMSFESCFTNLKNSANFNQTQNVDSLSACLLTGSPIKIGTGTFDILYDLTQLQE